MRDMIWPAFHKDLPDSCAEIRMKGSKCRIREVIAITLAGDDGSLDLHNSSGELRGPWVLI